MRFELRNPWRNVFCRRRGILFYFWSDSDTHYASVGQPEYVSEYAYLNVDSDFQFDHWRYAYYLAAELWKTSSTANPGLMAVQV